MTFQAWYSIPSGCLSGLTEELRPYVVYTAPSRAEFLRGEALPYPDVTHQSALQSATDSHQEATGNQDYPLLRVYRAVCGEFEAVNAAWAHLDLVVAEHEGACWVRECQPHALERLLEILFIELTPQRIDRSAIPEYLTYESWKIRSACGMAAARFLQCHPRVIEVLYPAYSEPADKQRRSTLLPGGFGDAVWYKTVFDPSWHEACCSPQNLQDQLIALDRALASSDVS